MHVENMTLTDEIGPWKYRPKPIFVQNDVRDVFTLRRDQYHDQGDRDTDSLHPRCNYHRCGVCTNLPQKNTRRYVCEIADGVANETDHVQHEVDHIQYNIPGVLEDPKHIVPQNLKETAKVEARAIKTHNHHVREIPFHEMHKHARRWLDQSK